jgi:hypothetical protein
LLRFATPRSEHILSNTNEVDGFVKRFGLQSHLRFMHWLVVGGGPCGIGSVGRLLDYGAKVTWVDPTFSVGRMGRYYRGVPANTLNGDLIKGFQLSPSLGYTEAQTILTKKGKVAMGELPLNVCYDLGVFVESLEEVAVNLANRSERIAGFVYEIRQTENGLWTVFVSDKKTKVLVTCDAVLLCCGASPTPFVGTGILPLADEQPHVQLDDHTRLHNLDYVVDPCYVRQLVEQSLPTARDEVWAVVGNSHSAMLVIKNLYECGVRNIVNYYRSDIKFMHTTPEGWVRYADVRGLAVRIPLHCISCVC